MKILFLTGTRADYGKIKVLINSVINSDNYSASIFVTGMHMLSLYGSTHTEISANRFMEMLDNFDSSELGVQKYFIRLED